MFLRFAFTQLYPGVQASTAQALSGLEMMSLRTGRDKAVTDFRRPELVELKSSEPLPEPPLASVPLVSNPSPFF